MVLSAFASDTSVSLMTSVEVYAVYYHIIFTSWCTSPGQPTAPGVSHGIGGKIAHERFTALRGQA